MTAPGLDGFRYFSYAKRQHISRRLFLVERVAEAMSRARLLQNLCVCCLMLQACHSSTEVGGYTCYPDGADRDDAEFCVWIDIEGGVGKAYVERNRKTVRLSILNAQKEAVLEREYSAEAGDLGWVSTWPEISDLQVVFYEYSDPQTSSETASGHAKLPRQVFSIALTYNQTAGVFVEALAPIAVLDQASQYNNIENTRHIVEISFLDTEENETRILELLRELAGSRGLQIDEPQTGIIGRLAECSARSFSAHVQRYDSLGQLAVLLEDYGNRELTDDIANRFRDLPEVVATRHNVGVHLRLGPLDLETVIQIVGTVAEEYGLSEGDRLRMFDVAKYGSGGLEVTITHFEREGKVKISIEDSGWHPQFEEIETALRSEFKAGGDRGTPDGI